MLAEVFSAHVPWQLGRVGAVVVTAWAIGHCGGILFVTANRERHRR
jgi:hypothetical protein